MCLGIPGQLVKWLNRDPLLAQGLVEFDGVRRPCYLACVLEAKEGDYLLVHAGIAIAILDPDATVSWPVDGGEGSHELLED